MPTLYAALLLNVADVTVRVPALSLGEVPAPVPATVTAALTVRAHKRTPALPRASGLEFAAGATTGVGTRSIPLGAVSVPPARPSPPRTAVLLVENVTVCEPTF